MVQFRSIGALEKEEKSLLGRTDFHNKIRDFAPIELDIIKSLMVILLIGLLFSALIFFAEKLYSKYKEKTILT